LSGNPLLPIFGNLLNVTGNSDSLVRIFVTMNPGRLVEMPNGRKRKRKKIATHKRKKRLRKNRHKKK